MLRAVLSFTLIFTMMMGNFLACSRHQETRLSDGFASDSFSSLFTPFESNFDNFNPLFPPFEFDLFASSLENIIFDEFSSYVNGVFVSVLQPNDFHNAFLVLETGEQLNISNVLTNIAIGSGTIIITSILLPALAPGLAPRIAIIVKKIAREALIGAALGASINGVVEYSQSNNSTWTSALYSAIEGAAEGFMWGALISSAARSFSEIRLLRQVQHSNTTLVNFSSMRSTSQQVSRTLNTIDDISFEGLSRTEARNLFRRRYGNQAMTALSNYTGGQYRNIQTVARGGQLANPAAHQRALEHVSRLDDLIINSHRINSSATFPRGAHMPHEEFARLFNTGSLSGQSDQAIANLLINKTTYNPGFTSTSLPTTPINQVNDWAIHGLSGYQANNIRVIRELYAPAGIPRFTVPTQINFYWQDEVIFARGLRTQVIDAKPDIILDREGIAHNIIRIFEVIIP